MCDKVYEFYGIDDDVQLFIDSLEREGIAYNINHKPDDIDSESVMCVVSVKDEHIIKTDEMYQKIFEED